MPLLDISIPLLCPAKSSLLLATQLTGGISDNLELMEDMHMTLASDLAIHDRNHVYPHKCGLSLPAGTQHPVLGNQ
jgi:hypothetical protein